MITQKQLLRSPSFWCHLAYVVAQGILLLTGQLTLWWIGVAIYVIPLASYLLFYWLPKRSEALKEHGKPCPPFDPDWSLGSEFIDLPVATSFLLRRSERSHSWLRPKTCNLYEADMKTDDGDWHYRLETNDDIVVAYSFNFESSKSKFLNYSIGRGSGYFFPS